MKPEAALGDGRTPAWPRLPRHRRQLRSSDLKAGRGSDANQMTNGGNAFRGQFFKRELARTDESGCAQAIDQSIVGDQFLQRQGHGGGIVIVDDEGVAVGDFVHDGDVVDNAWRATGHRFNDATSESFLARPLNLNSEV